MQPAQTQVTLDIELDSEPIQGSLSNRAGASQAFSGWIQLVSLLQSAAGSPAAQAPDVDPSANGKPGRRQVG
jgi:hypothetical protein